ncbi:GAP family protein [Streptomyces griseorubiginosus]|uniref:GAP family protein n=1 Tax=Streptomyces griseorubiginosus TaxID=67304 RepID=UPI001AD74BE2|nr:GAP family protein [Streptomyces griseorubiginosus]MBO4253962.1 GAP family protein [Streptomyces griseorubiginosus]
MVLDLVFIGLAIAVFPLSVTAFVLVLSADRGILKGLVFILAWLACFVAVLAAVLLTTGGKPPAPKSPPSTASSAVKLAIGVGLVGYGWYRHRSRHGNHERTRHRHKSSGGGLMARLDRLSLWGAAGMGPLLQPWGLVAAGAATVVGADLSQTSSYVALFGYCLLATSSLLAMEVYTTFAPDSARVRLGKLRTWIETHQEQALVAVALVAGLFLVSRSISQLTS